MSSVEHQATVDRGLKMKIKRKNIGAKFDSKHEIVKAGDAKLSQGANSNGIMIEKSKTVCDKDKSPKSKVLHNKKDKAKEKTMKCDSNSASASISNGLDIVMGQISMEPRVGETPVKKENPMPDPYEFNAKVEDGIEVNPIKKIKVDKVEQVISPVHPTTHSDTGTEMCSVGVNTQPECLGPCEPGTSVMLEGIVWNETDNGVLVVNVTWRGKTYVGTLLDATKHDWAPPRFSSDSPVSDFETRTPKGRGKRGRTAANTPVLERSVPEGRKLRKGRRGSSLSTFQAPPSPAKSDVSTASTGVKRKGRPADIEIVSTELNRPNKRSRSSSRGTPGTESPPALIPCPERNCNKKYKHINGLRYHQSHAHQGPGFVNTEGDEDMKDADSVEDSVETIDTVSIKKEQTETVISSSADSKSKKSSASVVKNSTQKVETTEKVQSKSDPNTQDNNKSEDETASKKKEVTTVCSTPVTSCVTTVAPKISVPVPQLYQITAAPIACLGSGVAVVSQATIPVVTNTSPATNNNTRVVATVPITVTAVTASMPQAVDLKMDTVKSDKNADRIKSKSSSARPIVPAPSPQMIALTSNVTVTSSTLAPVTTHTQVSPQLKAIQPKPTIMGDPTGVNPALVSLKDNKKPKPKKKVKEKESNVLGSNGKILLKDEQVKCERPAVIKSAPSPGKNVIDRSSKKDSSVLEGSRSVCDISKPVTASTINVPLNQPKGMDLSQSSRSLPPPVLKVGSPLQVVTPDNRKTPVTDDVQSPAYSDISDANESGSPGQTDSPHKHKDESASKKEERGRVTPHSQAPEASAMSSPYGMYAAYYGQSPYYGQSQNLSQSQVPKGSTKPQTITKESTTTSTVEEKKQPGLEERRTPIEKTPQTQGLAIKEEHKPKQDGVNNQNSVNQQQMQEYQQKWLQHMYALQALPPHAQYQYLAAYGYVDPNYHMQLYASDPQYRQHHEKLMEEQQKRQQDHTKPENLIEPGKLHEVHGQVLESRAHSSDSAAIIPQVTPSKTVPLHATVADKSLDLKKSAEKAEKDLREQALKEKQNENHKILKENIDLKAQMDNKNRYDEHYRNIRDKQADEFRRMEMFKNQKMIAAEQQKRTKDSVQKNDPRQGDSGPRNLSATNLTKQTPDSAKSHSYHEQPRDLVRKDNSSLNRVKETSQMRESSESKPQSHIENKMSEDKLGRAPSGGDKRKVENSKPSAKPFAPTKTGSPSNPTGNIGGSSGAQQQSPVPVASYPGNYMSYPYMQSPPYGHFDPNMYRGMNPSMMYGSYYSPQHSGYRVGNEAEEKEKALSVTPQKQTEPEGKPPPSDLVHNSQYYGSGHKIHELEKTRPSSLTSSPLPQKSVDPPPKPTTPSSGFDKHGKVTNSPPMQRHVHTHHHTHVVGGYPMYDPYGAIYAPGPTTQPPTAAQQQTFVPE